MMKEEFILKINQIRKKYTSLILETEFIKHIKHNTLSDNSFLEYIKQDAVFLIKYGECFVYAGIQSSGLLLKERLIKWGRNCLVDAINMGKENHFIEEMTTNSINILPTSQKYFDFLGSIKSHAMIEILFATLPCTISYNDIVLELDSDMIHNNKIRNWIITTRVKIILKA